MPKRKAVPRCADTYIRFPPSEYRQRKWALEQDIRKTTKSYARLLQRKLKMSKTRANRLARRSAEGSRRIFFPLLRKLCR